jgi:glycerophosphoryl diester phosphodiesterase
VTTGPPATTVPKVIAHRGASSDRPENTISAFDEALRQGCDGIELDIQLTRDEVPVVYHDKTLARAGGGRRRVSDLSLMELQRLNAGHSADAQFSKQQIPTLAKILSRYARRTELFIEIKTREGTAGAQRHLLLARKTARMVKQFGRAVSISILSFDATVLAAVKRTAPRIPRVLNLAPPARLGPTLAAKLADFSSLSVDIRRLTPAFARAVHRAGCPLLAFTCNRPQTVARALDAGASGIITNRPAWLRRRLEST